MQAERKSLEIQTAIAGLVSVQFSFSTKIRSPADISKLLLSTYTIISNVNALYRTIERWRKVVTIKRFDIRYRLTFDLMLVRG